MGVLPVRICHKIRTPDNGSHAEGLHSSGASGKGEKAEREHAFLFVCLNVGAKGVCWEYRAERNWCIGAVGGFQGYGL